MDANSTSTLPVDELCHQLAEWLGRARIAERVVCGLLAELADRFDQRAPELAAYADVYQLARLRFGMGVRRARERIRVGRALRGLPEVSRAFVDGRVGYAQVREVTRVATETNEVAWVALAETLPLRALEHRVAAAAQPSEEGKAPPPKELDPPLVRWTSASTVSVGLELPAATWALLERALDAVRGRSEAALSDAEALEAVAREALSHPADESERGDVRRMVVLYSCATCARAEIRTGAGSVELEPAVAARVGCGAARVDLATEGRTVTRGGEIPAAVRRAVLLRDRMRCRAPGCTRRRYVDVHHVVAREHGGVHSRGNCLTLCTSCHDRVHDGQLVVEGDAEADLRFVDARGDVLDGGVVTPGGLGGSGDAAAVLEVMRARRGSHHPDLLATGSGLPIQAVLVALMELELAGQVRCGADGYSA